MPLLHRDVFKEKTIVIGQGICKYTLDVSVLLFRAFTLSVLRLLCL